MKLDKFQLEALLKAHAGVLTQRIYIALCHALVGKEIKEVNDLSEADFQVRNLVGQSRETLFNTLLFIEDYIDEAQLKNGMVFDNTRLERCKNFDNTQDNDEDEEEEDV